MRPRQQPTKTAHDILKKAGVFMEYYLHFDNVNFFPFFILCLHLIFGYTFLN